MENIKVEFITSVCFSDSNGNPGLSYALNCVYDLPDTEANKYINAGWAVPCTGLESNFKRPAVIRFPKL